MIWLSTHYLNKYVTQNRNNKNWEMYEYRKKMNQFFIYTAFSTILCHTILKTPFLHDRWKLERFTSRLTLLNFFFFFLLLVWYSIITWKIYSCTASILCRTQIFWYSWTNKSNEYPQYPRRVINLFWKNSSVITMFNLIVELLFSKLHEGQAFQSIVKVKKKKHFITRE